MSLLLPSHSFANWSSLLEVCLAPSTAQQIFELALSPDYLDDAELEGLRAEVSHPHSPTIAIVDCDPDGVALIASGWVGCKVAAEARLSAQRQARLADISALFVAFDQVRSAPYSLQLQSLLIIPTAAVRAHLLVTFDQDGDGVVRWTHHRPPPPPPCRC